MRDFKKWAFQKFPFMEKTYKEIDNYHLMMDILHYVSGFHEEYKELILAFENLLKEFGDLETYVDNYFEDLDVQDAINQKLDEMTENGTLRDILVQENTLLIGDSYACGTDDTGHETLTSWASIVKGFIEHENPLNEVTIIAEPGSGFVAQGTSYHTFGTLLQSQINNIENKELIKNIIVCGGYNDKDSSIESIRSAIETFVNYCSLQFPNATVYIGAVGYRYDISANGATLRTNLVKRVYPAYANNVSPTLLNKTYVYLNGVENILKTIPKTYMYQDNPHPTQAGQNALAQGIYQAFRTGTVKNFYYGDVALTNNNATTVTFGCDIYHTGECLTLDISNVEIKYAEESAVTLSVNTEFELGSYDTNGFVGGINNINNTCQAWASVQDYSSNRYTFPVTLTFNILGKLTMKSWNTNDGSSVAISNVKQINVSRTRLVIPEILA